MTRLHRRSLNFIVDSRLTLRAIVKPLISHSFTSAGASTDVTFAASTNGSLMMLTVNSFVECMFSLLSLGLEGDKEKETLRRGGLCATCPDHKDNVVRKVGEAVKGKEAAHHREVAVQVRLDSSLVSDLYSEPSNTTKRLT